MNLDSYRMVFISMSSFCGLAGRSGKVKVGNSCVSSLLPGFHGLRMGGACFHVVVVMYNTYTYT